MKTKEVPVIKERDHLIFPCVNGSEEKVLKSEHPTEFGKTSKKKKKKKKNTAVMFKEKRMNQILQSNNVIKTN